jgi:hypothetical protein
VKAGTCRVRLEPTLLPFKSATQLQYLPETSHKTWTNFRGQDHHDLGDQENDNWVRFDDGPWYKFYSMEKQVWTWTTRFVDFEGTWRLDAGVHTMYIAPRSFGYKMDQIQIAREGLLSETDP